MHSCTKHTRRVLVCLLIGVSTSWVWRRYRRSATNNMETGLQLTFIWAVSLALLKQAMYSN